MNRSTLSPAQRTLVALMQNVGFGQILDLIVRKGEPVLEPMPRVLRSVRLGIETGPAPEIRTGDFALKTEVVEMLRQLDQLRDGVVHRVDIKNGLPISLVIEEGNPLKSRWREEGKR